MYLRKAHGYIIGASLNGFHFAGTAVSFMPEMRFPFYRIRGTTRPEYSAADTHVPRSTIYAWLKKEAVGSADREDPAKALKALKRKVARLEGIIEILKKVGCTAADPLDKKLPALEMLYGQYSVHMLCEALDVPRGTFCNFILRNKRSNTW